MQEYLATTKGPLVTVGYIDKDDVTPINVYWGAPTYTPSIIYKVGDIVKPAVASGYYHKCVKTGLAGAEPVWTSKKTISGEATFKAISYDLFINYDEVIASSSWNVTQGVTIINEAKEDERTSVVISAIPNGVTSFELTNQIVKGSGTTESKLSRTFKFTVNEQ